MYEELIPVIYSEEVSMDGHNTDINYMTNRIKLHIKRKTGQIIEVEDEYTREGIERIKVYILTSITKNI
jgi:hypothetical protein